MKTLLVGITVISFLAFGTLAFSHGFGGWGGGHMMGSGYGGGHMMGPGYGGGHMMGPGYGGRMGGLMNPGCENNRADKKFLDETADLRKEFHNKRFEYAEAVRNPDTESSTVKKLEKELYELEDKIYEKTPRKKRRYSPKW
jgi:hypothetical protein